MGKMGLAAAIYAVLGSAAEAQAPRAMLPGNLEPSQNLGCIGFEAAGAADTAADLALSSKNCLGEEKYDAAVESFITMQVFGVFDAQRVLDISAHQAVAVMGQEIAQTFGEGQAEAFQAAVTRFGGEGSARHTALCGHLRDIGPPTYFPRYMVQHGMEAFLAPDDDPIDPDFEAGPAWEGVLTNFLKCGAG